MQYTVIGLSLFPFHPDRESVIHRKTVSGGGVITEERSVRKAFYKVKFVSRIFRVLCNAVCRNGAVHLAETGILCQHDRSREIAHPADVRGKHLFRRKIEQDFNPVCIAPDGKQICLSTSRGCGSGS